MARTSSTEVVRGKLYLKLAQKAFLSAMEILHEYGHYGDQKTNGTNTGQFLVIGGKKEIDLNPGMNGVSGKSEGKQVWKESKTGHRGDDVTYHGFGVIIIEDSNKQLKIVSPNGMYDSKKASRTLNNDIIKKFDLK